MKRKVLMVRGGIIALLVLMLSLCFAFGVRLAAGNTAYADEGDDSDITLFADGDKLENEWVNEPSVSGWYVGEYNYSSNSIVAESLYGEVEFRIFSYSNDDEHYRAVIFGYQEDETSITSFFADELKDGQSNVNKVLSELPAGKYALVARVPASDEYTGLNDAPFFNVEDGVIFNVLNRNSWLVSPNAVSWTWGSFDKMENLFRAAPQYPEAPDVKFSVYTDPDCTQESLYEGLANFSTVGGMVDSATTDSILKELPAGTYYLKASQEGGDEYEGITSSGVQFKVFQAQNYWKTTPNIVQWKWNEFDEEVNVISAQPYYGGLEDIVFSIYTEENVFVADPFSYTKLVVEDEDGYAEISYVIEGGLGFLNDLHAGNYYLKADLPAPATNNYTSLSTRVPFRVLQLQNGWITTPSVTAWQYGLYNSADNAIKAVPAFGDEVTISVYHDDGEPVWFDNGEPLQYFTLENNNGVLTVPDYAQSRLKELSVGTYYMLASVDKSADGDYTGLNNYSSVEDILAHGIKFEIAATQNSWVVIPKVLSWSEGHFDGEVNKFFGEALQGNDKMFIYVLDKGGRVLTSNENGELDYGIISKLGVGSYTVRFEIKGTDMYSRLEGETTFAVLEDSVGLTGIIGSVIIFAIFDVFAAVICIILLVHRRRKIEDAYRTMIQKELHRR